MNQTFKFMYMLIGRCVLQQIIHATKKNKRGKKNCLLMVMLLEIQGDISFTEGLAKHVILDQLCGNILSKVGIFTWS